MRSEVYWVHAPFAHPGRLAIAPRPRGDDWLIDEVADWRRAGIDTVVSLLERSEEAELALLAERDLVRDAGMAFLHHPIEDRSIPSSVSAFGELTRGILKELFAGKTVLVHCRQGIGRSGLVAAAVLIAGGSGVSRAFAEVEKGRGRPVPDTNEQRLWLEDAAVHFPTAAEQALAPDGAGPGQV